MNPWIRWPIIAVFGTPVFLMAAPFVILIAVCGGLAWLLDCALKGHWHL